MNTLQPTIFLKYCHNYCFGEWNTHTKKSFQPFALPYSMTRDDFWTLVNVVIFDSTRPNMVQCTLSPITTCNENCHLGENMIICKVRIKRRLHSPCHRDLWLFPFLFWLFFNLLCSSHYSLPLAVLFSSHSSSLAMCFHSPPMCVGHSNFSTYWGTWEAFLISSTHHN
jgi:hypothetical protein